MKKNISQASCAKYLTFKNKTMEIELKEVQEWFASKSNKQVHELDMYDMFCVKVAYDYACEKMLDSGRSEQFNCFLEDSEQGERCQSRCNDCKDYKEVSN